MLTQSKKKKLYSGKAWKQGYTMTQKGLGNTALFNPLLQGYESVSIDPDDFEGKVVLILGRGDPF